MVTLIDVHLQSGNVGIYWLWLLLDVSAVSVVIVTTATCDMPREEFWLCEHVYIHNVYKKSRKSCSETRRKFWVKSPGRPVPNPSTIRRQAKRFKETGSIKNINVNRRRHVLTEETLDEIGERNWTEITERVFGSSISMQTSLSASRPASQGCERQPPVATHSIWEALYLGKSELWFQLYQCQKENVHFCT